MIELEHLLGVFLRLERALHLDLELDLPLLRLPDLQLGAVDLALLLVLPVVQVHAVVLSGDRTHWYRVAKESLDTKENE